MDRLSRAEEMVMSCLWEAEYPVSSVELREMIREKYHTEWAVQTLSTYIVKLRDKHYICSKRMNKTSYHSPLIQVGTYRLALLLDLYERFYYKNKNMIIRDIEEHDGL